MKNIFHIDHVNLGRLDLNLLIAFDALITEGSVTRAAERVGVGQPAMSHALGRLRRLFADDLFVRAADGIRPTPRALALAPPIREALSVIQGTLLEDRAFDPAAERTFLLGMPDSIEVFLLPRLVAHLEADAPKVRLRVRSIDRFEVLDQLDRDRLHLGVAGLLTEGGIQHKRRRLYVTNYLCLYDPARLTFDGPVTLDDYLAVPHVLGSPRGDARGVVDDALAAQGLKRTIAVTTPHFAAVPFALKSARLMATVPERPARIFAERFGLATCPVPVALPDADVSMIWHASYDWDPAHRWLRETVARLAVPL
ncbi:MAG: LysR family transcriptional regulator [Rhodospirillaceae bacterium]|nr:LysR family transcriptional regulator [Rhodospirillaceae bacterium]